MVGSECTGVVSLMILRWFGNDRDGLSLKRLEVLLERILGDCSGR